MSVAAYDQNLKTYEFEFNFSSLPIYLAFIPLMYIIPTIYVVLRIFLVFSKCLVFKNREKVRRDMDMNVFSIIVCLHFMNFIFFISDYLMYRFPATGILTPWCSRIPYSNLLTVIVFTTYYSALIVLLFPSVLSFIRLFLIISPYFTVTTIVFRVSLPLIFVYSLFFTFFLIPAKGICKPLGLPYPYGSVMVYYTDSYRGIHNSTFFLANNLVWMIIGGIVNIALLAKLAGFLKKKAQSSVTMWKPECAKLKKVCIFTL
ncbi:hypothetical protein CRE_03424 [Caenorhabditis remanei]|uniref:G-protein coupled receptors family 1 profile domain-containing protein n=1 Tax=Caenorhabditis remanei TaxID=31234 RepID=E3NAN2_CAERE|nr:hypothetical protein CRE_03424 [Caenorhabditis remanei]